MSKVKDLEEVAPPANKKRSLGDEDEPFLGNSSSSHEEEESDDTDKQKKKRKSKRTMNIKDLREEAVEYKVAMAKRGIVYISHIPPQMNPAKVKQLLSLLAEVTKVYLEEEDTAVRKRRKKAGGSSLKRYTEGWVEFASKQDAKRIALNLNNTPISNKKRDVHYGVLWNIKYLPKFQWSHLTEKVSYERRIREQKLRFEMLQAKRENAEYTALVEAGETFDKIEQKRKKKAEKRGLTYQYEGVAREFRQKNPCGVGGSNDDVTNGQKNWKSERGGVDETLLRSVL